MTIIEPSRRGFIAGLASLIAAPAIVRAGSLMPVKAPRLITGYEILQRQREFDVLFSRMYVRPEWLKTLGEVLFDRIPTSYDTLPTGTMTAIRNKND